MSSRQSKAAAPLVLVVDDHDDNRQLYADYLESVGYAVETAENGQEAVILARRLKPVAVVMDLTMPVMDGWEATQTLKSAPATKDIWIIAVTAHADRQHVDRAYAAGADTFALQPLAPKTLVELVAAAIARARGGRR